MDEAQSLGATLVTGCAEGLEITDTPARVRGVRIIADGGSTTLDLRPFTPARFSLPLRARN